MLWSTYFMSLRDRVLLVGDYLDNSNSTSHSTSALNLNFNEDSLFGLNGTLGDIFASHVHVELDPHLQMRPKNSDDSEADPSEPTEGTKSDATLDILVSNNGSVEDSPESSRALAGTSGWLEGCQPERTRGACSHRQQPVYTLTGPTYTTLKQTI